MGLQEWEPPFAMLFPDSYKAFCNKKIILGKKSRAQHIFTSRDTCGSSYVLRGMDVYKLKTNQSINPAVEVSRAKQDAASESNPGCGVKVF